MLSDETLQSSLIEFRHKSFAFERRLAAARTSLAVFSRTETETESKFRPRLVHLVLLVPHAWLEIDPATEELLIQGVKGPTPSSPSGSAEAQEVAAEPEEFSEASIDWVRRTPRPEVLVYLPKEGADALLGDPSVRELLDAA